jgi:hypothetical protein
MSKFLKEFNTQEYSRTMEFIYVGNEQSQEELQEFIDKDLGGGAVGGYHFEFNEEQALQLRAELRADCVPMVIVLDHNLEVLTRDGAADLMHFSPEACRNIWI